MEIIIGIGSFNLTSKMNRNSYTTTKYWMKKLFLILEKRKGHGAFISKRSECEPVSTRVSVSTSSSIR